MIKLLYCVYTPSKQLLEVTVEDQDGKRRRIDYNWNSKEKTLPPDNWFEIVCLEVEFQKTEEFQASTGRKIF